MRALKITASLIDELLASKEFDIDLLVCEVPILDGSRKVDLLAVAGEQTICFEIKSAADNLEKLDFQIADYLECFQLVYVVLEEKHLKSALKTLSKSVGIVVFEQGGFRCVRGATLWKRLKKRSVLSLFLKKDLVRLLNLPAKKSNALTLKEVRDIGERKKKLPELVEESQKNLLNRYLSSYKLFLSERGSVTHTDDLILLANRSSSLAPKQKISKYVD